MKTEVWKTRHVNRVISPIRVTLAERKLCSTNTIGFGQDPRSNSWKENMKVTTLLQKSPDK